MNRENALEPFEAEELSVMLSTLEDWLLHTGEDVLDELARFAFCGAWQPRAALDDLVDTLGTWSVRLHRLAAGAPR